MSKKLNVEWVNTSDLEGKTVAVYKPKKYYYPERYSWKITSMNDEGIEYSFLLTLAQQFNDNKLYFLEFILKNVDSRNITKIDIKYISSKLQVSKQTIYTWINKLVNGDLLVKVSRSQYMVNPDKFLNYRKISNSKIPTLLSNYLQYKNQPKIYKRRDI